MKDLNYYKFSLSFSFITTILLLFIIQYLTGLWLTIHIFLIFAFLLIVTIGIYGLANKKDWAPVVFLLLFAAQAIDGFYLFSITKNFAVYAFIIVSIFALYKTAANADIYKIERKRAFFRVQSLPKGKDNKKKSKKKTTSKQKKSKRSTK